MSNNFFENPAFREIILKKFCGAGRTTDDTTLHAGYLRLQTHTQHML